MLTPFDEGKQARLRNIKHISFFFYLMDRTGTQEDDEENNSYVDLSCLELRTLDIQILSLTHRFRPDNVRRLVLYGNVLKVLPSCIVQFTQLQELDVSSNDISWISGEVSQIKTLRVLEARNNSLQNLPKEIQLCSSLRILNLSGNLYTDFPPQLFELKGLQELYLGGNKIVVVPPVIQKLKW